MSWALRRLDCVAVCETALSAISTRPRRVNRRNPVPSLALRISISNRCKSRLLIDVVGAAPPRLRRSLRDRFVCVLDTSTSRQPPQRRAVASAPHLDFQSMRASTLNRCRGRCAASTVSSLSLRLRHIGVDRRRAVARAPHLVLQSMRIPPLISSLVAALRARICGATFVRGHRAGFGDVSK